MAGHWGGGAAGEAVDEDLPHPLQGLEPLPLAAALALGPGGGARRVHVDVPLGCPSSPSARATLRRPAADSPASGIVARATLRRLRCCGSAGPGDLHSRSRGRGRRGVALAGAGALPLSTRRHRMRDHGGLREQAGDGWVRGLQVWRVLLRLLRVLQLLRLRLWSRLLRWRGLCRL